MKQMEGQKREKSWKAAIMRRLTFAGAIAFVAVWMVLFGGRVAHAQCEIQSVYVAGSVDTSGAPGGVAISGSYAYVTSYNHGLDIIDVSNPQLPQIVGSLAIAGEARDVDVSGSYAYVATMSGNGLQVVDISNPSALSIVGSAGALSSGIEVSVSGSYAYVAAESEGLKIIDVSIPSSPHIVSSIDAEPLTSAFYGVTVSGSYAYVAAGTPSTSGKLKIVDVSDPESPSVVASLELPNPAWSVDISGSHAYLATFGCCGGGLEIVDISEPSAPFLAGTLSGPWWVGGFVAVAVSGSYAYTSGLEIIDISNPSSPYMVNEVFPAEECGGACGALDVAVSGSFAYVTFLDGVNNGSLQILDISHPSPLPMVHTVSMPHDAKDVATSGAYAYVATGDSGGASLEIVDHSNPATPAIVGSVDLPQYPQDIAVSGSHAYVTIGRYPTGEIKIVDISNPAAPQIAGSVDTSGMPNDVAASGTYVYVVDGQGLRVIDATDPSSASIIGSVDTLHFAQSVVVSGSYAYVADWAGIEIIDISEPTTPQIVGSLSYPEAYAVGVAVSGSYAYIADERWGLKIADVTDPSAPYLVGSINLQDAIYSEFADIKVFGSYAYVAMYASMSPIKILDISDPSTPRVSASLSWPGISGVPTGIEISGSHAYISDERTGLEIVQLCPTAAGSPAIASTQTSLTNTCDQGTNALSQSFDVFNSSDGTLSYFISDTVSWLYVEPFTGGSEGEHDTIEVSYSTSLLSPGTHTARITVADPNATNNPQYLDVTLTVIRVTHVLTTGVSPDEGGTVTGGGEYEHGQTATTQANPNQGWKFDHWEGDDIAGSTDNPEQIIVNADKSITAVFVPNVLTHIDLVSPEKQATVISTPTFVWSVDGGTDNAFAVDLYASPLGPIVWSSYENGHQLIRGTSWAMPQTVWRQIGRGKTVFWRVRGVDFYHKPLAFIRSDEMRSFKKR